MREQRIIAIAMLTMLSYSPTVAEPPPADDVVCDQCVDTSDIAARAINASRLGGNAVRTNKIRDGAVTSAKILDGTVTESDLNFDPATQAELDALRAAPVPLVLIDGTGSPVGIVVDFVGTPARVYYVGDPSQAAYFQFREAAFLDIKPDGFSQNAQIYWTSPLCEGDPYVNDFTMIFNTVLLVAQNDPVLGDVVYAPIDPDLNRETVDIKSRGNANGDCFDDIQTNPFIAVEPVIWNFIAPYSLQ